MVCERKGCVAKTEEDLRYCSDWCYNLDNDDFTPVTVLSPNKANGFGYGLEWSERQPVIVPFQPSGGVQDGDIYYER